MTETGRIVYPAATGGFETMLGHDPAVEDLNGTALGTHSSTTLQDTTATWTSALLGAKIYMWSDTDPATDPQMRAINAVGGTLIGVNPAWDTTPTNGDRYTIDPVPFKVRPWPMFHPDATLRDFGRRVVTSMGIAAMGFSGTYDVAVNPNAVWRLGVCRNLSTTVVAEVYADFTDDPADEMALFKAVAMDGMSIEPHIEHISSDTNFELTSVVLNGRITSTRGIGS